jgi:arginyl-tRNA synthetase
MINEVLRKLVNDALVELQLPQVDFVLEHPADLSHGDYASNVALIVAKQAGENPKKLAEKCMESMHKKLPPEVQSVSVAGPGFINFHLSPTYFSEQIDGIHKNPSGWGRNNSLKGKKVLVEYTDPNPFKELHIGHLMSNAIGESVSRLYDSSGAEVKRVTYQGDVGPHIAKALWGLMKMQVEPAATNVGKAYATGNAAYESDEAIKAEIDAINKKLYAGTDPELMALYEKGKKASLDAFDLTYRKLGSHFDRLFFESESATQGLELVEEGIKKGVFEESEGAIVYRGEKHGLHTRVFKTKQGTPTYEAKELGLEPLKQSWWKHDLSVIMTGKEQKQYFEVILSAMRELLPDDAGRIVHIPHGFLRLPEGKMSSRSGNVITAEFLIGEVEKLAREKSDDPALALTVAVAAIKYEILKQQAGSDIIFDTKKSLSFEGDSGPYLQYSRVRALSVLEKAKKEGVVGAPTTIPEHTSELARLLQRFPEVVLRSQQEREPHHVTTYLTHLASAFNSWYASEKIVDPADASSPWRVALTEAFETTMKNGLWLLGIGAPEKM